MIEYIDCPSCHTPTKKEAIYCNNCGTSLSDMISLPLLISQNDFTR